MAAAAIALAQGDRNRQPRIASTAAGRPTHKIGISVAVALHAKFRWKGHPTKVPKGRCSRGSYVQRSGA